MPVPQAVIKNVLPAVAAMIMVLIYNLADTFFIGQTHDDFQVAAVSLATPVFLLFMSLGNIFGIGGTSVISRALGENRREFARKVSAFCAWASIGAGVIASLLMAVFLDKVLSLIGASDETWDFVKSYLSIVLISGPFVLFATCFSNILRAEGQSNKAMMGALIGNVLNIILDPIMILLFDWGIAGAAVATVIGNVFAASYYFLYFLKKKSILSIGIRDFSLKKDVFEGVLTIGIPAALGSLLMSVSQIIMNSLMASYGDMEIAAVGVAMKVTMITGMISIGLGQGVQPLLGYSFGARNLDRYRNILRFSVVLAFLIGVSLTLICLGFTHQIVGVFLTEKKAMKFGVEFTHILLTTSSLFGVFYVLVNALQAIGAAKASLMINLSRQGILYIPALFILRSFLNVQGLIWAQPLVDVLSIIIAAVLYASTINGYKTRLEYQQAENKHPAAGTS